MPRGRARYTDYIWDGRVCTNGISEIEKSEKRNMSTKFEVTFDEPKGPAPQSLTSPRSPIDVTQVKMRFVAGIPV